MVVRILLVLRRAVVILSWRPNKGRHILGGVDPDYRRFLKATELCQRLPKAPLRECTSFGSDPELAPISRCEPDLL